jgi:hypothetical protein
MSLHTHLDTLQSKHAYIEKQIEDAYHHFQDARVTRLKKQKLSIKDEINQLLSDEHQDFRKTG